jgi:ABC-2 type transport system permease protein
MMASVRLALMNVRLVMRTKVALFFTFLFPLVFLFLYAGLFAHGNPQAVAYLFGPVVTLNIMGSGFWGLGLQAVVQRERGSLRRFRLAPIGPGSIVASNLLANYLLQLPTLGLLVICARVFFHMPLKIGLFDFLILATVGVFAFAGFGLIIASVANTMQEAQIYNNLAWITLLFLSGTTIPLPMLPKWIQTVATFLPATYLVSAFQAVMVQSQPLYQHWPEMLALAVSGAFGLLFAWKLFRWEKEERISRRQKWWTLGFVAPFLLVGTWMNAYANPRASWSTAYTLMEGLESAGANPAPSIAKGVVIEDFDESVGEEELLKRWQVTTTESSVTEFGLSSPGADGTSRAMTLSGRPNHRALQVHSPAGGKEVTRPGTSGARRSPHLRIQSLPQGRRARPSPWNPHGPFHRMADRQNPSYMGKENRRAQPRSAPMDSRDRHSRPERSFFP